MEKFDKELIKKDPNTGEHYVVVDAEGKPKRPTIAPKPDFIYQYRDGEGKPVYPKVININLNI